MIHNYSDAVSTIVSKIHELRQGKAILVALDGRSGTGKSTLAMQVAEKVNGIVVVGDDFYSGGNDEKWAGQSAQFKSDQVIDWKRMRVEVLEPLKEGKRASWHPLDFEPEKGFVGWKEELVSLAPANVIILEGAYSARPELRDIIDLAILIEASDEVRRHKLKEREGPLYMDRWHAIWDEAEDFYFTEVSPKSAFDLVIQFF